MPWPSIWRGNTHMTKPEKQASPGWLRIVRIVLWVAVALAAIGAIILYNSQPRSSYGPPTEAQGGSQEDAVREASFAPLGGPFQLTSTTGETFTEGDLKGKPHAMFFGFTRCPDVCPTALQRMAKLRRMMNEADPGSGEDFDILFVTVDPENDTREVMADYVRAFGTPIIGLTGTEAQIDQVTGAYGVYHAKRAVDGGDYTMDHSAAIFLLDDEGNFAATIDSHESDEVAVQKLERLTAGG